MNEQLPEACLVVHPTTRKGVLVRRGEEGCFYELDVEIAEEEVRNANALQNISWEQERAMLYGSMFGFDKPVADPEYWRSKADGSIPNP